MLATQIIIQKSGLILSTWMASSVEQLTSSMMSITSPSLSSSSSSFCGMYSKSTLHCRFLDPDSRETPKVRTLIKENLSFLDSAPEDPETIPKSYVAFDPDFVVCLGHLRLGSRAFDKWTLYQLPTCYKKHATVISQAISQPKFARMAITAS